MRATTPLVAATIDGRVVAATFADGRRTVFHHRWLLDNCPQLRHPATGHRVLETSTIPADVTPSTVAVTAAGELQLCWADGHVSTFDPGWLAAHDYAGGTRLGEPSPVLWDSSLGDALARASYPLVRDDPSVRRTFLRGFRDLGVAVLADVPTVPGTVLEVGALFGEVRSTSWGTLFDVYTRAEANSVAYTNLALVAHTDEAYRDPAPTIQLQHFLVSDPSGGLSTFVDGFRIAEDLRRQAPAHFEALARTRLHFHFRDAEAIHEHRGPVIELDGSGTLRAVRFSNHSVRPFLLPAEEMDSFYEAYTDFGRRREDPDYQLRLAMQPGELYLVDNRRVLHGRTAFAAGGARHLQSCYIERDELLSRLAVLEREGQRCVD